MQNGRILFRLTDGALFVANTGRPFSLRGLEAVVYGCITSKAEHPELDLPADRVFQDESDARTEVERLHNEKRSILEIPNQRASEISQQAQTAQSYAGRVLLELLQNTVDANRDTPIGYKGIGFRSILTLTDSPEIHSGHLHVRWSPEIARNALNAPSLPPAIVLALPQWCPSSPREIEDYDTVIKLPLSEEQRSHLEKEWEARGNAERYGRRRAEGPSVPPARCRARWS